ncbi:SDR family oxidoreductase [Marispirochaeta aestuarii]|uniref:SDR family NAD(P)-dependent oxidoreductase n=1 Tax=Marispirochaeta aestuarii TaxID=1963862 RepID=UPI0029C949C5|nr:SDR family oxidoreductase [Marispirochaeta aestuarii]
MKNYSRFTGKTALVSGAGSGIGRSCALRLAAEGCKVAAADVSEEALAETVAEIKNAGGDAFALKVNLASVDEIYSAVAKAVKELKSIDILVNTAGVVQSKWFLDVTEKDWDFVIDINQKGAAFLMQAVAKEMVKRVPEDLVGKTKSGQCFGKIVNFSSISGRSGRPLQIHYASSKAAVISLTQSVALALAPYSINVNAVSPSVVDTPMWRRNVQDKISSVGEEKAQAEVDRLIGKIPLLRPGLPDEMADAVLFLCSEESNYMTGQTLNVDGGFEMN